jgi:hypothetical protein
VESTPDVVYRKINQEVFSPTDSLGTATSLEDLAPDSSPRTLTNTPKASLTHQRTSSTAFAHTPIQVGIFPLSSNLLFVYQVILYEWDVTQGHLMYILMMIPIVMGNMQQSSVF